MTVVLILITHQDLRKRNIGNLYIIEICFLAILRGGLLKEFSWIEQSFGFFAVSMPMVLLNKICPKSFGSGDIKMMAAAGGFLGGCKIWKAFCVSILLTGFYILIVREVGKKKDRSTIAFGPFLSLGIFLVMW